MSLPGKPDRKQPVSADAVSRLIQETRARTLSAGPLGLVQQRGNGMIIARRPKGLTPPPPRGGGAAPKTPFMVEDASDVGGTKVTIYPGTVNGIFPTVDGNPILDDPAPTLDITNSGGNTGKVVLKITSDPLGSISEIDILFFEDAELPSDTWAVDTGGTGYLVLALTEVNDGGDFEADAYPTAIMQIIVESLAYAPAYGHLFTGF